MFWSWFYWQKCAVPRDYRDWLDYSEITYLTYKYIRNHDLESSLVWS